MAEPPSGRPPGRGWNPELPLPNAESKESANHRAEALTAPRPPAALMQLLSSGCAPPAPPSRSHSAGLRPPQLPSPLTHSGAPTSPPRAQLRALTALTSSRTALPGQHNCSSGLHCIPALLHGCGGGARPHSGPSRSRPASIRPAGTPSGLGALGWRLSQRRGSGAESSPRPPAAAAVRSGLQQRALRDPPRPEQQRGRGALRGEGGGRAQSRPWGAGEGEGAPHPPQCSAPPPGTAAPAPPPPERGCRRSSAVGLERREGAVWGGSHGLPPPSQLCAPRSPALTAHVLPAGPVHRQHLQRVEDGAVRAHRAGVSAWGRTAARLEHLRALRWVRAPPALRVPPPPPAQRFGRSCGRRRSPPAPQQQRFVLRDVIGQQLRHASPLRGAEEAPSERPPPRNARPFGGERGLTPPPSAKGNRRESEPGWGG